MASLGTAHYTVRVVMQETEAQLAPVLVIATTSRATALLVIRLLACRNARLLMNTLLAFWHRAAAGCYAVDHF